MEKLKGATSRHKALILLGAISALVGLVGIAALTPIFLRSGPVQVATLPPASPRELLQAPQRTILPTRASTPIPSATAPPAATSEAGLTPLTWLEVSAPVAYPGDLPYLAAIAVQSTRGTEAVVADIHCEEVMLLQGTTGELALPPEQTVYHFFVIPPGHRPRCHIRVGEQECGEWSIEPGGEDSTSMTCVVLPTGADE
jgi:hypothetical protein